MKKNVYIIFGVIVAVLVVGGVWYFYYLNSDRSGKYNSVITNQNTSVAASASDHFKVTPLTKEFIVDENTTANYGDKKVTLDSPESLPVSTSFKSFSYDQTKGESISITGSCADAYYAVIIFQSAVDYKIDPTASVINQAFECPEDKKFTKGFELKDFNLVSGEYYFFVADQGNAGSWYNPR